MNFSDWINSESFGIFWLLHFQKYNHFWYEITCYNLVPISSALTSTVRLMLKASGPWTRWLFIRDLPLAENLLRKLWHRSVQDFIGGDCLRSVNGSIKLLNSHQTVSALRHSVLQFAVRSPFQWMLHVHEHGTFNVSSHKFNERMNSIVCMKFIYNIQHYC